MQNSPVASADSGRKAQFCMFIKANVLYTELLLFCTFDRRSTRLADRPYLFVHEIKFRHVCAGLVLHPGGGLERNEQTDLSRSLGELPEIIIYFGP